MELSQGREKRGGFGKKKLDMQLKDQKKVFEWKKPVGGGNEDSPSSTVALQAGLQRKTGGGKKQRGKKNSKPPEGHKNPHLPSKVTETAMSKDAPLFNAGLRSRIEGAKRGVRKRGAANR